MINHSKLAAPKDHSSYPTMKDARHILHATTLAAVTLAVFGRAFGLGFVSYDDDIYVYENPIVLDGVTWAGVQEAFTKPIIGHWHPLTWLSLMADQSLFGTNGPGFHATSILLHVANTLLLYALLSRLTGASTAAFVAALLFSIHPMRVEPVVWVSSRKDVLSMFFLLLSLLAYSRYRRAPGVTPYMLACVAFAAGLLSKSMLVTLPVLMLLLDYWPLRNDGSATAGYWARRVAEKIPMFVLAAGAAYMAYDAGTSQDIVYEASEIDGSVRAAASVYSTAYYLKQIVWPFDLGVDYEYPFALNPWTQVVPAGILLGLVSAAALALRRRLPYVLVGWFWYLIALAPVSGLLVIGSHLRADRYMYIPLIGLIVAAVWTARSFVLDHGKPARRFAQVAVGAIAIGCAVMSVIQIGYWRSDETLYARALTVEPENSFMHLGMSTVLADRGDYERAAYHVSRALELAPDNDVAMFQLGQLKLKLGDAEAAVAWTERIPETSMVHTPACRILGHGRYLLGRYREAVEPLRTALAANPGDEQIALMLGASLREVGDLDAAEAVYLDVLRVHPNALAAHKSLGALYAERSDVARARTHLQNVLAQAPDDLPTLLNLGKLLYENGEAAAAIPYLQRAVTLLPRDHAIRQQLIRDVPGLEPQP